MGMPDFARHARGLLVALAAMLAAGTASAQSPSPEAVALAEKLIQLRGASAIYQPVVSTIVNQAQQFFMQTNPADSQLAKDVTEVGALLRTRYEERTAALGNDVAKIYASRFTVPELKEALAFFQSKTGRKLIAEEPKAMEQTMNYVRDWGNKFSEEVLNNMRDELHKRGHDL